MTIKPELAALVGRVSAGEQLSSDELARLESLMSSRKRGRPPRDDPKRFRDEFGRAIAYFFARAEGMGDTAAIKKAEAVALAIERRIRGGVKWVCDLAGADGAEFVDVLRSDAELARRVSTEGIEALTKKEVLVIGSVSAFIKRLEKMLPPSARATIFVRHLVAFNAANDAVFNRARAGLRALTAAGEVTEETRNLDLLEWVDLIASIEAEAQVQKLAELLH